jgi:hypothetical protein
MNWFWTLYEKLVKKSAEEQQRPVEKAIDKATEKVIGPLVK